MLKSITNARRLQLTLSNACSIPANLLLQIEASDGSIHGVRKLLNSHFKPEFSGLANTYLDDLVKESKLNKMPVQIVDVKAIVSRFAVLNELGELFAELNKEIITRTGKPIDLDEELKGIVPVGNDSLTTVKLGVLMFNIAMLTEWAYVRDSEQLDTYILPSDFVDPYLEKAAKALEEKRFINLIKRIQVDQYLDLIGDENGNYTIRISKPIRRALAQHLVVLDQAA